MITPREPPHSVTDPVMLQTWDNLSFIHWAYPPETVQRLLPTGVTVETFNGQAWVGIVPFLIRNFRVSYLPVPEVHPGDLMPETAITELDHFLTSRYTFYTQWHGKWAAAYIEYKPWPLRQASSLSINQNYLAAAGIPQPSHTPTVHYTEPVDVKFSRPHFI